MSDVLARDLEPSPAYAPPSERQASQRPDAAGDGAAAALPVGDLVAVREITQAARAADRPEDLYEFALARACRLVGASFGAVHLVDGASDVMRLAAVHAWPAAQESLTHAAVRIGSGPTGLAAAERRAVEVPDASAELAPESDEVARALGARVVLALPLVAGAGASAHRAALGALTFYFAAPGALTDARRALLAVVADEIASAAERAALVDELRRANGALVESNGELERQYVEVLEARRVKDEFLANVGHELRTPLAAAMGYVSLLLDELSGPLTEAQRRDLLAVQGASGRLLELIENLLELAALKRGALEVTAEEFDPRDALREALSRVSGPTLSVALRVHQPDTVLPAARSDLRKVVKILVGLLTNAYKFTASGEVSVAVEVRGAWMAFRVRDTGIGIPPDAHQMVFDEFRQVDGSAARRYGGSGLGLALARRLARLLGGDIELESAVGAGSTFTVELPLDYIAPTDPRSAMPTPALGTPIPPAFAHPPTHFHPSAR